MSVKVMGQVWELDLPHAEMFVLLAMADHADHEGKHVRPSLELIAWKTNYSKRQVIRIMHSLESKRLIRVRKEGGGRGRATEYTLHLENGARKSPFRNSDAMTQNREEPRGMKPISETNSDIQNSDIASPNSINGVIASPFRNSSPPETVTFATQNSDIAMSPQPSLEPKPKRESRARARDVLAHSNPRPSKHVPLSWEVSEKLRAWAAAEIPGVNIEYETKKFRDWEFKDPHSDWDKAWRGWMRRAWEQLPASEREPLRTPSRPFKVVL